MGSRRRNSPAAARSGNGDAPAAAPTVVGPRVRFVGDPIAMVIAWAFERAPDGKIARTKTPEGETPRTGVTRLDVLLLEDGSPQDVRRTPGRTEVPGQLEAAGRQAARRWAFSPARLDGCPVPFQATIATNFVLR